MDIPKKKDTSTLPHSESACSILHKNHDSSFKDQILKYENDIYLEYISKRTNLIENINNLQLNTLTTEQLYVFINDLKMIIDPIKNINNSIDHYLNNKDFTNTESSDSLDDMKGFIFYHFFFKDFLNTAGSGSESVSDSNSDSDSEPDSLSVE